VSKDTISGRHWAFHPHVFQNNQSPHQDDNAIHHPPQSTTLYIVLTHTIMSFYSSLKSLERLLTYAVNQLPNIEHAHDNPSGATVHNVVDVSPKSLQSKNASFYSSTPKPTFSKSSKHEYSTYYLRILESLREDVAQILSPQKNISTDLENDFYNLLEQEMHAQTLAQDAKKALEQAQTSGNSTSISLAEIQWKESQQKLQETLGELSETSALILDIVHDHWTYLDSKYNNIDNDDDDDDDDQWWKMTLLTCTLLANANIDQLASYSAEGEHQANQVQSLLQNPKLIQRILQSDGPKQNNYASALEIYHSILQSSPRARDGVEPFDSLALAVALEHAVPIHVFDTKQVINPLKRYHHYESAYLNGELDENFSNLTTWEMRMIVNNDANDDEIAWCRRMLRNYRPDHILNQNDQWKYCMIVKSDVRYKRPEWLPHEPKSYKVMLSNGGMCGPRAWFGRFVCKSFGVPTWGLRQPGHAAMSHRIPNGDWVICLGGPNWQKSYWEEENGIEFDIDTKARKHSRAYRDVILTKSLSEIHNEPRIGSQHRHYNKRNVRQRFWTELTLQQKKRLSLCSASRVTAPNHKSSSIQTHVTQSLGSKQKPKHMYNNQIVIPAASCISPRIGNGSVIFMPSFDEEYSRHIHLRNDAIVKYQIHIPKDGLYSITMNVVTVHIDCKPLRFRANDAEEEVHIPYTAGEWCLTKPVFVHLSKGYNQVEVISEDEGCITIKDVFINMKN
jgi:hypothetical protein